MLLLVNTLIHLALGWALGLTADEAHYALYAANPALSYYDHPPLVGWIQWPLVTLNAPDGVLRMIPAGLWLATAWLTVQIAGRLAGLWGAQQAQSDQAALWAVLAFSLCPIPHLLGIALLPDTLLMLFTAATLVQTLRMLDDAEVRRPQSWLLLGALLGLAGLSKYTAVFVALPVLLCLLWAHGWRRLLSPWPWLAVVLAAMLVLPVFVWNAQHDWLSFRYQLHHGGGSHWQLSQMGVFILAQALLYPLLIWGGWCLLRANRLSNEKAILFRGAKGAVLTVLSFFVLPFVVLMLLSGGGSGLPHWTAPAWVALSALAGLGLAASWAAHRRRIILTLAGLQGAVCVLLFALMLSAGPPWQSSSEPPDELNPFTDFHGWEQAGHRALELARDHQVQHLAVQNWTLASRLAWYARPMPVHVLAPGVDQFSFWFGEMPIGASAVVMDWTQMAYQQPVGPGQFEACQSLESLPVQRAGRRVAGFSFLLCSNWGGVPSPRRL